MNFPLPPHKQGPDTSATNNIAANEDV